MSEMTDEEYDYTRISKGLVSEKTLKELQEKYKNVPYMLEAIKVALKEIEDEYNR